MNEKRKYEEAIKNLREKYNLKNAIAYMTAIVDWREKQMETKIKAEKTIDDLVPKMDEQECKDHMNRPYDKHKVEQKIKNLGYQSLLKRAYNKLDKLL